MINRMVLAGGSGYIGGVLLRYFRNKAREIVVLSRGAARPSDGGIRWVAWDGRSTGPWAKELEGADLLVNLSGRSVNCRYTPANRKEILRSRIDSTEALGEAIRGLANPPRCWIQFASATIYRHAEDRGQTESGGDIGSGFSVDVCTRWERSFREQHTPATKKIIFRVSIVLGREGGAFPQWSRLTLFGLGGHQGTGAQKVSWIHEDDVAAVTEWALLHGSEGAVYNLAAPEVVSNAELMRIIRRARGIPIGLPTPAWLLELGAALIGTETELLLKSRWVVPERFLAEGYRFQYPRAETAIRELLSRRS